MLRINRSQFGEKLLRYGYLNLRLSCCSFLVHWNASALFLTLMHF